MNDLKITTQMEKTIQEKTKLVDELNNKSKDLLKKELHEKTIKS